MEQPDAHISPLLVGADDDGVRFYEAVRAYIVLLILFTSIYTAVYVWLVQRAQSLRADSVDVDFELERGPTALRLCAAVVTVGLLWLFLIVFAVTASAPNLQLHWLFAWVNAALVGHMWWALSWSTVAALFGTAPFAFLFYESMGFHRTGTFGRVLESVAVAVLFAVAALGSCAMAASLVSDTAVDLLGESSLMNVGQLLPGALLFLLCFHEGAQALLHLVYNVRLPWNHRGALEEELACCDAELLHARVARGSGGVPALRLFDANYFTAPRGALPLPPSPPKPRATTELPLLTKAPSVGSLTGATRSRVVRVASALRPPSSPAHAPLPAPSASVAELEQRRETIVARRRACLGSPLLRNAACVAAGGMLLLLLWHTVLRAALQELTLLIASLTSAHSLPSRLGFGPLLRPVARAARGALSAPRRLMGVLGGGGWLSGAWLWATRLALGLALGVNIHWPPLLVWLLDLSLSLFAAVAALVGLVRSPMWARMEASATPTQAALLRAGLMLMLLSALPVSLALLGLTRLPLASLHPLYAAVEGGALAHAHNVVFLGRGALFVLRFWWESASEHARRMFQWLDSSDRCAARTFRLARGHAASAGRALLVVARAVAWLVWRAAHWLVRRLLVGAAVAGRWLGKVTAAAPRTATRCYRFWRGEAVDDPPDG